jgi:DNA-binding transcriptional LysR family regulator
LDSCYLSAAPIRRRYLVTFSNPAQVQEGLVLEKLEFMIALAREKHFGRAAESCGVAQPTLSQGIQQLEEMLNVQLVKRSSRFLGFTPEGERVLVWARRLVGDAQAMRQEIIGMQHGEGAQLRIAAMPAAMPLIASLTAPFQIRNPSVRFTLITRTSDEIIKLLHEREIDAGVRYISGTPSDELEEVPLFEERYLLLTTAGRRFGDSSQIAWSDLSGMPLCLFAPNLQQRQIIDETLRRHGIEVRPAVETDSILALTTHVHTGLWVSVVSNLICDAIDLTGSLRTVPIVEPEVVSSIGLIVSKRFPLQPAMTQLLAQIRSNAFNGTTGSHAAP